MTDEMTYTARLVLEVNGEVVYRDNDTITVNELPKAMFGIGSYEPLFHYLLTEKTSKWINDLYEKY